LVVFRQVLRGYPEASEDKVMAKFTAIVEQAEDGSWSAYTVSPTIATGTGATKEAALADLKTGMAFWLEYMKDTAQQVPAGSAEVVSFEVAA
jgi:predicted RNase H-like HicB family nuclease